MPLKWRKGKIMKFMTRSLQESIKKLTNVARKNTAEAQRGILYKNGMLSAFNSEIAVSLPSDNSLIPESFLIPEKAFSFIGALTGDETEIKEEGGKLHITCGKAKSSISSINMDGYVEPTFCEAEKPSVIDAEALYRSLDSILFAVSDNPSDKRLGGAYIATENGTLSFVGINGVQIACSQIPFEGDLKMIVPKKALSELQRLKLKGKVSISTDSKGVTFRSETGMLYARLIEGEYYNIKNFMISNLETSILDKMELLEAFGRVNACAAASTSDKVPVVMEFADGKLSISYKGTPEYEEVIENVDIGKDLRIGFSPKLITESLGNVPGDKVEVSFGQATSPLTIKGEGMTSILMPVNIQNV